MSAPWRPPQWTGSAYEVPALTMTATSPQNGQQTAYVFDGIIRAEHDQQCIITLNPVQTGAAISDNAYIVPARLVVEIAMSDSMRSFTIGQWADAPSRSVSAYQTLVALQAALSPVQVATRLRQYNNMMLTNIRADEEPRTKYALKASVTFTQIITASVQATSSSTTFSSEIPQSTNQTQTGQIQPQPVPSSIQSQNSVASTTEASTTAGSPVVSVEDDTGITIGDMVTGDGIPPGTTVDGIGADPASGTPITLSAAATASSDSVSLTFFVVIPSTAAATAVNLSQVPQVDGSGNWSSYNVNSLANVLAAGRV